MAPEEKRFLDGEISEWEYGRLMENHYRDRIIYCVEHSMNMEKVKS